MDKELKTRLNEHKQKWDIRRKALNEEEKKLHKPYLEKFSALKPKIKELNKVIRACEKSHLSLHRLTTCISIRGEAEKSGFWIHDGKVCYFSTWDNKYCPLSFFRKTIGTSKVKDINCSELERFFVEFEKFEKNFYESIKVSLAMALD